MQSTQLEMDSSRLEVNSSHLEMHSSQLEIDSNHLEIDIVSSGFEITPQAKSPPNFFRRPKTPPNYNFLVLKKATNAVIYNKYWFV